MQLLSMEGKLTFIVVISELEKAGIQADNTKPGPVFFKGYGKTSRQETGRDRVRSEGLSVPPGHIRFKRRCDNLTIFLSLLCGVIPKFLLNIRKILC